MSSRNRYLSPDDRQRAGLLSQALRKAKQLAQETSLAPAEISAAMIDVLGSVDGIELQYAVIADGRTLELLTERSEPAVALIAARVGTTRLIDNEILHFSVQQ
jgi:pantoate--beta-alanine ligase